MSRKSSSPTDLTGTPEPGEKLYFSISEVSERLEVPPSTLRFWEKEFDDLLSPRKSRGGHRLYTERDIDTLRMIHYLVKVRKFTLQGAREKLKLNPRDVEQAQRTRDTLLKMRAFLLALRQELDAADQEGR